MADVLAMARQQPRAGHPLPAAGPELHWPPQGFDLEARLQRRAGKSLLLSRVVVAALTFWADLVFWNGIKVRGFSSETYRRQLVENSDIKKFDDGLMMTIDCAPETVEAIARRLDEAERAGSVVYGLHRQSTALVTCMVLPRPCAPTTSTSSTARPAAMRWRRAISSGSWQSPRHEPSLLVPSPHGLVAP